MGLRGAGKTASGGERVSVRERERERDRLGDGGRLRGETDRFERREIGW